MNIAEVDQRGISRAWATDHSDRWSIAERSRGPRKSITIYACADRGSSPIPIGRGGIANLSGRDKNFILSAAFRFRLSAPTFLANPRGDGVPERRASRPVRAII